MYDNWDWETVYPVIHISFGAGSMRRREDLELRFRSILENHADEYGLKLRRDDARECFEELILALHKTYKRNIVILVDEYDKPILECVNTVWDTPIRKSNKALRITSSPF